MQLVIQDNGRGIPMELDGKLDRGHGMSSMKHRAKQLQGQCLVESGPGYGTVIRLTLPLERHVAPAAIGHAGRATIDAPCRRWETTMKNILLLEDLPEIRAWLKALVMQVFPDALHLRGGARARRARAGVGAEVRSRTDRPRPARRLGRRRGRALRESQPEAQSVVVTIHDDDDHLFPALQAGAYGYILKEQARELIAEQLQRISQGEPPLSPSIARKVIAYFAAQAKPQQRRACRTCR